MVPHINPQYLFTHLFLHSYFIHIRGFFSFAVLGIKLRAWSMLAKLTITKLHHQPWNYCFNACLV
jgi:hypothetical protein